MINYGIQVILSCVDFWNWRHWQIYNDWLKASLILAWREWKASQLHFLTSMRLLFLWCCLLITAGDSHFQSLEQRSPSLAFCYFSISHGQCIQRNTIQCLGKNRDKNNCIPSSPDTWNKSQHDTETEKKVMVWSVNHEINWPSSTFLCTPTLMATCYANFLR